VIAMSNVQSIPKLLRAIAGGEDAKAAKHDVILMMAAKLIERLEGDLIECEEYLDQDQDVVDGSDGQPRPNRAMYLCNMIKETLHGPGAF
jgi:hypothetical protein